VTTRGLPLAERFYLHVAQRRPEQCWLWTGAVMSSGYGCIRVAGTTLQAHRVSYEIESGETIPPGVCVLHRCDNRRCVNPAHLFPGSVTDNNADRHRKGRSRGASHKGSQNPMAKLTDDEVRAIAAAAGKQADIAARYGVPFQCVSAIKRGTIWAHATGIRPQPARSMKL